VNAGLRYLLVAGVRGIFRRTGRRMRTFRGFVTTVFGGLFLLALGGTQLMALLLDRSPPGDHANTVLTFSVLMMALLVPALVTADAPFFWPQEVQFLFPAPLTRRELLVYQMLSRGWVQLLSALWLGLVGMRSATHPAGALAAAMLGMLFLFALAQVAGLVKVAAADRLPRPVRTAVKPVLGLAALIAAFVFYRRTQAVGVGDAVADLFASPWLHAATLPARPFGQLFAARTLAEGAAWAAGCTALVAAAAVVAVSMTVDFRERSLVSSARRFERLRRMRAGRAGLASSAGPARRRIPVPELRFLGPAAPIARRQMFELGRGARALWNLLFTAGIAFFYVIVMPRLMGTDDALLEALGPTLVVLVIVFPLLASGGFSIDFRRDLERMPYLRSLPLRPMSVAVGEVFTSALLIAVVNLALLAVAAGMSGWRVDPLLAVVAAAGAAPVAWLAVTLENWLFLLFPTRTQADGGQQNAFMGKQLLKMAFKLLVLALVAAAAGAMAAGGAWIAGRAGAAAGVVLTVAAACVGATALLARAYRGFDLTVDSPA
jgi:ABC-2 type transport system permease protein